MISDSFEARREHQIEEEIIVSINCHLVLELTEIQEGSEVPE